MIKINKVYTRKGDKGQTGIGDGTKLQKNHIRIESFGAIDEANSAIGIAISSLKTQNLNEKLINLLVRVQSELFELGAELCVPNQDKHMIRITENYVTGLEKEIDEINKNLKYLDSFILPGGRPESAHMHLARTLVRRAERSITQLSEEEQINPTILSYINRLSDLLFVIARKLNDNGKEDVLWKSEKSI